MLFRRMICCICVCAVALRAGSWSGGLTAAAQGEGSLVVPTATLQASISATDDPAVWVFSLAVMMEGASDDTTPKATAGVYLAGFSATLLFPDGVSVEEAVLAENYQQEVDDSTEHLTKNPFTLTYRAKNDRIDLLADGAGKASLSVAGAAVTLPLVHITLRCSRAEDVPRMTATPFSPRLYVYDAQGRLLTLPLSDAPLTPSNRPSSMPSPPPPAATAPSRVSYVGYQTTAPLDGSYAARFLFACPIQRHTADGAAAPLALAVYPTAGQGSLTLCTAMAENVKAHSPQREIIYRAVNGEGEPCVWFMFTFEGLATGVSYRFAVALGQETPLPVTVFRDGT